MKYYNPTIIYTLLLTCFLSINSFAQENQTNNQFEFTKTIASTSLNEIRKFTVTLPQSYYKNNSKKYPVLYALDGQNLSKHTKDIHDFLAEKNYIPEMIIVSIDHTSKRSRDYYTYKRDTKEFNKGVNNFTSFIKNELFPSIDKEFRNLDYKIITGHSSSGLFVLHSFIKEPSLFNAFLAFSPSIHHTPEITNLLSQSLSTNNYKDRFLYLNVGDKEFYKIQDGFTISKELISDNAQNGLRGQTEVSQKNGHRTTPFIGLYNALIHLYAPITFYKHSENTLKQCIEHYKKYSLEFGYEIKPVEQKLLSMGRYFFSFNTKEHDLEKAKRIYTIANHYYPNSPAATYLSFINKWEKYGTTDVSHYNKEDIVEERRISSFGEYYLNNGKPKEANFIASLVTRYYPNSYKAFHKLGESYEALENFKEALSAYKKTYRIAEKQGEKELLDSYSYQKKYIDRVKKKL